MSHPTPTDGPLRAVFITQAQHDWLAYIAAREGRTVQEQVEHMVEELHVEAPPAPKYPAGILPPPLTDVLIGVLS